MVEKEILKFEEPFIFTELEKKGSSITRKDLAILVKEGKLQTKKIGRMNLYWREISNLNQKTGLEDYTKQLEVEISELKGELMDERQRVRKLSIQDGIDEPWKETAMAMARILSEQKQISMKEVLEHFNAPLDDY